MLEQLIASPSFWGVVGVVTGFLLGEGSRFVRYRCGIVRRKKIVSEELKSIKAMIPQKKDIIRQAKEVLPRKEILNTRSVESIAIGYEQNIGELYLHLAELERNCLHIIYNRLKIADHMLNNFEQDIRDALREGIMKDPFGTYDKRFDELVEAYDMVNDLITSYLEGKPKDVFYVKKANT